MIVINDTLGVYGGSHTLMLRMCQWLSEHKIHSAIVCASNSNREIAEKISSFGTMIICTDIKKSRSAAGVVRKLQQKEEIHVISFAWSFYMDLERVKKKYRLEFDHYLYCIHPETFKKGIGFRNPWLREYAIRSYQKIYQRMNANRAIVMMDEINTSESNNYMRIQLDPAPAIIRLPMYCHRKNDAGDIIDDGYDSNMIMTAARADFPYKGYMLGLVDDFVCLKKDFPQIRLQIVSAGDDIDELKQKIRQVPSDIRKDICLEEWVPYEQLLAEMRKCRVFIGMGTSVLDAALNYKPAIAVQYSTYENISDHFIADKPGYFGTEQGKSAKAVALLRQSLEWNRKEYEEACNASFQNVCDMYNMNICMGAFVGYRTRYQGSLLSGYECFRHHMNNIYNNIRFRKIHAFDYEEINAS